MKSEHLVGTSIPRFTFDTPTTPGNDFYKLCEGEHPLAMIFLPAFDHPVTREYLTRYLQTLPRLRGVRLACVVHSSPRTVAKATQGAEFPFTLICDAPGVLYGYLGVDRNNVLYVGTTDYSRSMIGTYDAKTGARLENTYTVPAGSPAGIDFTYRFSDQWLERE